MGEIFKAYDIRGIYGSELTEDIAYKTARSLAQLITAEQGGKQLNLVVGADMRLSSPSLKQAVIQGILDEGCNVIDIGLVSTPAFYFGVAKYGYDGGLMVSASHNPPQYNGLKMVRAGGVPVSRDTGIMTLRDAVAANTTYGTKKTGGMVTTRNDIVTNDVMEAIQFAGTNDIKPFKIVADAANAMGATYLRELFKQLPCELIEMNFDLDGTFPAHEADPFKEENNRALMQAVVAQQADLGIATDGDGDRIFFVDNEGKLIEPAMVRGIMAQLFLEQFPGSTICYDIRPGRITRDMIEQYGGKPCVTKVGHSLIKEQALKLGAVFAGESSGHFFVKLPHGTFEAPCIVTLRLLQFFSRSTATVADQIRPLRKYFHSGEINSTVQDKAAIMEKIKSTYGPTATATSELDGITIEYPDYWFNVRASNTEALLRLNLEATSAALRDAKTTELLNLIRA
ncbi:MAG: phosphomannomutase/phosphoglucomutase [Candidatus Kerfeldbacteria bacterium]|nr:phosphomannomutase/phosphoglucomutase [Candidatus Kerfeldbacteria bacterium]